jgi:hypothetical protein
MKFFVAKNDIKGMVVHYGSNIFFLNDNKNSQLKVGVNVAIVE